MQGSITQLVSVICALSAWRATQGIYRFHPEVLESLWETELTDRLPVGLFYRMPEWCVYIETPGRTLCPMNQSLLGFCAFLECDQNTRGHELRLMLDFGGERMGLIRVIFHISGQTTISEMIEGTTETVMEQNEALDNYFGGKLNIDQQELREIVTAGCDHLQHSLNDVL